MFVSRRICVMSFASVIFENVLYFWFSKIIIR